MESVHSFLHPSLSLKHSACLPTSGNSSHLLPRCLETVTSTQETSHFRLRTRQCPRRTLQGWRPKWWHSVSTCHDLQHRRPGPQLQCQDCSPPLCTLAVSRTRLFINILTYFPAVHRLSSIKKHAPPSPCDYGKQTVVPDIHLLKVTP